MALTTVSQAVSQFESEFFEEFVRENEFSRFQGTSDGDPIQLLDMPGKNMGNSVYVNFVTKLANNATTGTSTLKGNEESLANYSTQVTVDMRRHAAVFHKMERQKTKIDLAKAIRSQLMVWAQNEYRDDLLKTLNSVRTGSVTEAYADTSEANKDTWLTNNTDRVLFGAATSNHGTDHSAALGNCDTTNDTCTRTNLSTLKRVARLASPQIRPIRVGEEGEFYVVLIGNRCMRDLRSDLEASNRDGWIRGKGNPIFRDSDLIWNGMLCVEVPEITNQLLLTGVGAASADVEPVFLLGAQAVAVPWVQRPKIVEDVDDYEARRGIGVEWIYGVEKLEFNSVMNGVAKGYFAATAD